MERIVHTAGETKRTFRLTKILKTAGHSAGLLLAVLFTIPGSALATTVEVDGAVFMRFNTKSLLAPDFTLAFGFGAGGPSQIYNLTVDADTGEAWLTGTLTGAVTREHSTNHLLSDDPVLLEFEMHYTGLTIETDPETGELLAATGFEGASGEGSMRLESDFFDAYDPLEFEIGDQFAGNADPYNFLALFGDNYGGAGNSFAAWFLGLEGVWLFGQTYNVRGDFSGAIRSVGGGGPNGEVPEPATAVLFAAGLLGGVMRKRQLKPRNC